MNNLCKCNLWKLNIKQLDDIFIFYTLHNLSCGINNFIYCPYCGNKLKRVNKK